MAHATLLRQNTAPATSFAQIQQGLDGAPKGHQSMSNAPRASQLSGSTAFGSTASLSGTSTNTSFGSTISSMNTIVPTANIINQKADASRSLYQICVALKARLGQVPDFEPFLEQLDPHDPVDPLWNLLKTGQPLLVIYNALQPETPLSVGGDTTDAKKAKLATFKFIKECLGPLSIAPSDCFVITDLMGNDTSGFVKVIQVINYVLDLAEGKGLLLEPALAADVAVLPTGEKMSYRDHIVKELVDTERKYVQDLENLHDLKKNLEHQGHVTGDTLHSIFLNINAILDFQRRFLIRVETTNSQKAENQNWGIPFVTYEEAFDIYQPFIANQRKAALVAQSVFDKIQLSRHPVAIDLQTFDGFLLKPMQRLVKYPLLLKDLAKKTEDLSTKADLTAGCEAAERVLSKANEAVNRDLLDEALEELIHRVDDWKTHSLGQFGSLLMHGCYTVITGSKPDQEKDYEIYLFETILLCCKEVQPLKNKEKKDKTRSQGAKPRNKSKLQLKGRIYMSNVTDVMSVSKPGMHSVEIYWKGDPGVEHFTVKFTNEETMRKWALGLDTQRRENAPQRQSSQSNPDAGAPDFAWTQAQAGGLQNPYLQEDEDEDDDRLPIASAPPQFPMPRAGSSSNLRSRSTTNDSLSSIASTMRQAPPSRFPMPGPPAPLSLQTQNSGAVSPGTRGGESYFSPVEPSPASSRASTASGAFTAQGYGFPKTSTPQPNWEESTNTRYTAPAVARAPSRDGPSPNPYTNGRNTRGPSLSAMASRNSDAQQQRSRSYSTPDIQAQQGQPRTRQPSQGGVPAVPGIPSHLHPAHDSGIPRSNTGSPRNDMPIRSNTQSPGAQRERMHQHSGSLGGQMGQFPSQPIYSSRSNTPSAQLRVDPQAANSRTASPGISTATLPPPSAALSPDPTGGAMPLPTQLKVRVNCDSGNYVTLVVAFNITYQSLIDRIDAKLARFTGSSIGKGVLKLRYRDEDGDFVTIQSDDDIQIAFMEWREGVQRGGMMQGGVGEIELFCVGDTS